MTAVAVIPTYIRSDFDLFITKRCIESLRESTDLEIYVVDDCSPYEGTREELEKTQADKFTFKESNEGFSHTVNFGLRYALETDRDALLVNADMEFPNPGWFEALDANPADVVGALLLYPNGLVQHAGIFFSVINRTFDHIYRLAPSKLPQVSLPRTCPVTGALQLIRNDTLNNVGLYDERFRLGWEDVAYCHDVFISGRKCAYEPQAIAVHYESLFRGSGEVSEKIQKWQWESWCQLHEKFAGHEFASYTPTMLTWDGNESHIDDGSSVEVAQ